MAAKEVRVPALGESVSEATVAQWLKAEGEAVKADEPIVELETDKITLEVNAPSAGVLSSISAGEGTNVEVGALLGMITEGAAPEGKANENKPAPSEKPTPAPQAPQPVSAAPAGVTSAAAQPLSPAVKKIVAEKNIDPSQIAGTGKDGRLTKGDVLTASPAAPRAMATPARDAGPREEKVKMTRLRQRIAQRLKDAQNTAAILTTFNEVDMSAVMALRNQYKEQFEKAHGVKLGFMSFFVKAAIQALQEIPAVNAEIAGDEMIYKNYYDIGVAVGTDQGLVVPVVRDADQKSLAALEAEIGNLGKKARDGKLSIDDMTGGTFTITNGGVYGSLMSTPILNPPQSGILGMHKIEKRPVVVSDKGGDKIEIRPMMYIALSYDHRMIDGKEAVTFLVRVKECIEDPQRLLLAI